MAADTRCTRFCVAFEAKERGGQVFYPGWTTSFRFVLLCRGARSMHSAYAGMFDRGGGSGSPQNWSLSKFTEQERTSQLAKHTQTYIRFCEPKKKGFSKMWATETESDLIQPGNINEAITFSWSLHFFALLRGYFLLRFIPRPVGFKPRHSIPL